MRRRSCPSTRAVRRASGPSCATAPPSPSSPSSLPTASASSASSASGTPSSAPKEEGGAWTSPSSGTGTRRPASTVRRLPEPRAITSAKGTPPAHAYRSLCRQASRRARLGAECVHLPHRAGRAGGERGVPLPPGHGRRGAADGELGVDSVRAAPLWPPRRHADRPQDAPLHLHHLAARDDRRAGRAQVGRACVLASRTTRDLSHTARFLRSLRRWQMR